MFNPTGNWLLHLLRVYFGCIPVALNEKHSLILMLFTQPETNVARLEDEFPFGFRPPGRSIHPHFPRVKISVAKIRYSSFGKNGPTWKLENDQFFFVQRSL